MKTFSQFVEFLDEESKKERVNYINDHREAVGREPLPHTMDKKEIEKHEKLIDKHAPYGNDPWDDED